MNIGAHRQFSRYHLLLDFQPAPTPPSRTTSKRNSKMDAQKAMELAAKDEAEDVDMGLAEEEEGPAERLEQGPPKAPAKVGRHDF